jgi:hypothetical protein
MFKKIQPPVGTVIETQEDAYLLYKYCGNFICDADILTLHDVESFKVLFSHALRGYYLPYTVTGVVEGYTPTEHWRTGGELTDTYPIEVYNATLKELQQAQGKLEKIKEIL